MTGRPSRVGFTLLEILLVVAIVGILAGAGIVGLNRLGKNQAYQGYVAGFGQAVSDATSRANETNTIYALVFDQTGYRWGAVGGALSACTGAASAPALSSVSGQKALPSGVATTTNGWLCFSAPGLVHRLTNLASTSSCSYLTYTFPCVQFTGPGKKEDMFVSVGGQVLVQ